MKLLVGISRFLVGALFIFSGLIKLNDPLGFSYKLQEYFSQDVLNIPALEPYALGIAVVVVVLEVVLGVFLLIGYKPKFTVYSLLAMIVFFTFLTFYAAYFEKVKDCGCFGDFMKLDPWESFYKDLILLILIIILVLGLKYIKPIFGKFPTTIIALLGFLGSLWFGYHVLMHLPTWDFRAYKKGANIQEGMIIPEDAPKAVLDYYWKFNVNGEEKILTTQGSYPDVDGEFIGVETKEIQEGYTPPIQDFSIESEDEDLTQYFLEQENLLVIVSYNLRSANAEGFEKVKEITDYAAKNGYQVIGLTSSDADAKAATKSAYGLDFDFYLCDEKVLKTIVRSNPGIALLNKGTVMQKVHFNDVDDLELPKVERKQIILNSNNVKISDNKVAYFINGEQTTKSAIDSLDVDLIESVNVLKDSALMKELNLKNLDSINGAVLIKLKN